MKLEEINQKAWEIAAQSIMLKNREFEAYSHKQIRGFFELAKSKNFEKDIEGHIHRYQPQPSQRGNPREIQAQLTQMRELNRAVGGSIKEYCKNLKADEKLRFFQYLLWNIKIIENRIRETEKIQLIHTCERVKRPETIINQLKNLTASKHTTKNQGGR